jgi:hypothetical protein
LSGPDVPAPLRLKVRPSQNGSVEESAKPAGDDDNRRSESTVDRGFAGPSIASSSVLPDLSRLPELSTMEDSRANLREPDKVNGYRSISAKETGLSSSIQERDPSSMIFDTESRNLPVRMNRVRPILVDVGVQCQVHRSRPPYVDSSTQTDRVSFSTGSSLNLDGVHRQFNELNIQDLEARNSVEDGVYQTHVAMGHMTDYFRSSGYSLGDALG